MPTNADRDQHERETAGEREDDEADEGEAHPERERIRLRPAVGVEPHKRLEERGGELIHERDQSDVPEIQLERVFQNRINRRDERLHGVVEQMRETERGQNGQDRSIRGRAGRLRFRHRRRIARGRIDRLFASGVIFHRLYFGVA